MLFLTDKYSVIGKLYERGLPSLVKEKPIKLLECAGLRMIILKPCPLGVRGFKSHLPHLYSGQNIILMKIVA